MAATTTRALGWPLVGRDEECGLLRSLRSSHPPLSAFITGEAGVGKSRLAEEARAQAAADGWTTLRIRGTEGFSLVPLGPLRTVLEVPNLPDLAALNGAIEAELLARRTGKGLLLLVDDAQHLDQHSAGLVHQLVASGALCVIVTARSGTPLPAPVTDLWKDGLAERLQLQNLSCRETAELLAQALGDAVEDSSASRIWNVTSGNPLYVREVVLSSQETGALGRTEAEWRWRGRWATAPRLKEIVAARLGRLDQSETSVMEMVALTGSLPLDLVAGLAARSAVEELERRGLIVSESIAGRIEVAIAHPLHAEVLRSGMAPLQQRAIWRNLVDTLAAQDGRRPDDLVRLACWSIEAGIDVDPITLAMGSDATLFTIATAISARLQEILPDGAPSLSPGGPSVRQDFDLALRLARAAYDRTGSVAEGAALASAYAWAGDTQRAETVVTELVDKARDVDEHMCLAVEAGWIRFWCHFDVQGARAVLLKAAALGEHDGDPDLLARLYEQLAGIALNTARPSDALAHAERAAAVAGVDLFESPAAPPAAAALSYLGRYDEALALVDRAVPYAHEHGTPLAVATLLFARAGALARRGDLHEAHQLASWLRDVALSADLLEATANFGVLLGEILLRRGRAASAERIMRDSAGLLADRDPLGYRAWALSGLARALAQTGRIEAAARALEQAEAASVIPRHFEMSLYLAKIAVAAGRGNRVEAERIAREAVEWAREAGMLGDEALALEACLRLVPCPDLADRLDELAGVAEGELVKTIAAYGRALVAEDSDGLLEVSERFARLGATHLAVDAVAASGDRYRRHGRTREERAASRRLIQLLESCEEYVPPPEGPARSVRLTRREIEIATLAARGTPNKQIAEQTYLSIRTVENHLHRAYTKLGVSERSELALALGIESC